MAENSLPLLPLLPLHIYFIPLMVPSHMMSLIDMARQFARHKAKVTILLTNLNATQLSSLIQRDKTHHNLDINIRHIKFPTAQVGLPDNCESLSSVVNLEMSQKFGKAISLLAEQVHDIIQQEKPNCIVADFFISWASDIAEKLGIPRLIFHATGFFPLCMFHNVVKYKPFVGVQSDSELFIVPDLPHVIKMSKRRLQHVITKTETGISEDQDMALKIFEDAGKAEEASFGAVVNSFKELEPDYMEYYTNKICTRKVWHVGPVSLCNKDNEDTSSTSNTMENCLKWLNTQQPKSVMYVCFGSISSISDTQLLEIATGLESSEQKFIWAIRYDENNEGFKLPEKIKDQGLIINAWVPQLMILEHESVGGFLTHCGWNSFLEGITAGVPMVTWPLSAEQFDNELLVTEILKIGAAVGVDEWKERTDTNTVLIKSDKIAEVVRKVMVGEEAMEMRKKVTYLSDEANKATQLGGSSYQQIESLFQELRSIKLKEC